MTTTTTDYATRLSQAADVIQGDASKFNTIADIARLFYIDAIDLLDKLTIARYELFATDEVACLGQAILYVEQLVKLGVRRSDSFDRASKLFIVNVVELSDIYFRRLTEIKPVI